ncbi:tyrosine-protein phosphatase 10D-like, partial [Saccoglossus kowalevskii]|uniref:protein-tyrosine-phosphatase n=1 Tax=Saccoglossus kowalevskii TaxID=10224 RepID=A0ABM0M4W8_SACKO
PERPGPIVVTSVTVNRIYISWSEAAGIADLYEITYIPDNGIDNSPTYVLGTEYTLTGLTPVTEYSIAIKTTAGQLLSEARQTNVYTMAPPPRDVLITDYDTTSIDLSWLQPVSVNIDRYIVTLDPPRDDGVAEFDVGNTDLAYTLRDLRPGREYDIDLKTVVLARDREINSVPTTVVQRTIPTPPQSITVDLDDIGPTYAKVSWQPSTGDVDEYVITYRPYTTASEPWISASPLETSKDIVGLMNEPTYTFTIMAYSGGLQSTPVTSMAVNLRPYGPGQIRVVEVTRTEITVIWSEGLTGTEIYEVSIREYDDVGARTFTDTISDSSTYTFTNLQIFVKYLITVCSIKSDLKSLASTFEQRTFGDIPGPVRHFEVSYQHPFTVVASFRSPVEPNGVLETYIVTFLGIIENAITHSPDTTLIIADASKDVYTDQKITGFKPGYTYTFSIQAENIQGRSNATSSTPHSLTMPVYPPLVPGVSPHTLRHQLFKSSTHTSITLNLWYGLFDESNGPIVSYTILVAEIGVTTRVAPGVPQGWREVKDQTPRQIWQTNEQFNLFVKNDLAGTASPDVYVIGSEDCSMDTDKYCNGPLQPLTQYIVKVRAFIYDGRYTDTEWSMPMMT